MSAVLGLYFFEILKEAVSHLSWQSLVGEVLDDISLASKKCFADTNVALDHFNFCFCSLHPANVARLIRFGDRNPMLFGCLHLSS